MKKLLFFAFALLALNFTFTSCSDDDVNAPDSLVNTTWRYDYVEDGETYSTGLTFISSSTVNLFEYGYEDDIATASYTYSKPTVKITYSEVAVAFTGTVNGNKMTFKEGDETAVFIKQ